MTRTRIYCSLSHMRQFLLPLILGFFICASFSEGISHKNKKTDFEHAQNGNPLTPAAADSVIAEMHNQPGRVTAKTPILNKEELIKQAEGTHSQALDVLVARGASIGAMAKVAQLSRHHESFKSFTVALKELYRKCDANEDSEECKTAKATPLSNISTTATINIGKFARGSEGEASSRNESEQDEKSTTVDTDRGNAQPPSMAQLGSVFSSMWDTMFGGAGSGNADNFEGGNQGSFFNFMYPSDNDYPWACVCDEGQYKQWESKQVSYVQCRNQVDLSSQNAVPMCNPQNHKMNAASQACISAMAASFMTILIIVN